MIRRALLPAVCVVALTLTGCSGDQPGAGSAGPATGTSSANAQGGQPTAPAVVGSSLAASPGTSPATSSTADPAASRAAGGPASPGPATAGSPTAVPLQQSAPAGGATAAGQYAYATKGTVTVGTPQPVDGETTLTVDPPAGGQQHSVLQGDQGRTEQDVVLRQNGRFLANLSLTNPAFSKTFRPQPAVLLLPTPAEVGRSWSWKTISTDGKTTASTSSRILRKQVLTIGGERVDCVVVETTLALSGDVTYRGQTTTWASSRYRLPVQDHTRGEGTISGVAFSTDITTTLRSTRPA